MQTIEWLAIVVAAYLLGAIPFGLILGKLSRGIDIRDYGSGKVGATNALRTLGPAPSAMVFLADFGKAAAAIVLARALGAPVLVQSLAATAAIVGHCWSIYIGFNGGRGVSSSVGALAALAPVAALIALGSALVTMALTRYVSLGSLLGTAIGLVLALALIASGSLDTAWLIFAFGATTIVFWRHRDNIERLLAGTERRLGQPADQASGSSR